MKNTPIYTRIRNMSSVAKVLYWTGDSNTWIGASATVEVPFDVWSCAKRTQRDAILAVTQQKSIELTLCILQADGTFLETAYDPSLIMGMPAVSPVAVPVKTETLLVKTGHEFEDSKIIRVGGGQSNKTAEMYNLKAEAPAVVTSRNDGVYERHGFNKVEKPALRVVSVPETTADSKVAVPEPAVELQNPISTKFDDTLLRTQFAECVETKKWVDALKLLQNRFGKDQVSFTTRVIMSMKDYDAIVTKYKLVG